MMVKTSAEMMSSVGTMAGVMARSEIESLLGSQVNLQLWVKVRRRWRDDQSMLDRLGFDKH